MKKNLAIQVKQTSDFNERPYVCKLNQFMLDKQIRSSRHLNWMFERADLKRNLIRYRMNNDTSLVLTGQKKAFAPPDRSKCTNSRFWVIAGADFQK